MSFSDLSEDSANGKARSGKRCSMKKLARLDIFRESYNMHLDSEMNDTLATVHGSIISIIMSMALLWFTIYRISFVVRR